MEKHNLLVSQSKALNCALLYNLMLFVLKLIYCIKKYLMMGVPLAWGFGELTMWLQHTWLESSFLCLLIFCHKNIIMIIKKRQNVKNTDLLCLWRLFSVICHSHLPLLYPLSLLFSPPLTCLPTLLLPISPCHTIDTWVLQLCHYKSGVENKEGREKMKV